jgi:hypothetical protein
MKGKNRSAFPISSSVGGPFILSSPWVGQKQGGRTELKEDRLSALCPCQS